MKTRSLLLPLILLVILSSCGGTRMTATWKNPEYVADKKAEKIFVAVLARKLEVRQSVENALADEIIARGGKVLRSYERFPVTVNNFEKLNTEIALNSIREAGCDVIMVVSLLDKKEETRYVEGSAYVYPGLSYGWYGSYSGYYGHYADVMYSPGYTETSTEYYLETSIFNAITEKMIWTGQSVTYSPNSLNQFVQEYKHVLLYSLKKDGIIK